MTKGWLKWLAPEGRLYSAIALGLTLVVSLMLGWPWSLPFWLILIFVLQFFREPVRDIPGESGIVVSPADGKVVFLGETTDPYLNQPAFKISVFMNVFSVHSNRIPISGVIKQRWYNPGQFFNAALDKASTENERNALLIESKDGQAYICVQIAGLIARRILCYVGEGDHVDRGQRYGFIRFGSRVDLYLPTDFEPAVSLGDKVFGGKDILGHLSQQSESFV